ncbi:hypothetical protein G9A89_013864 [Geosiphon pyriformis]|nr:hypothetical protein G9A89_013864 [Geosiphon pyriformis]
MPAERPPLDENFIVTELKNIQEFQHGIKPNSFKLLTPSTSKEYVAEFEIGLLEGINIKIRVSKDGFMIVKASCCPKDLEIISTNDSDLEHVLQLINQPFETMDALLLTTSSKYKKIFHEAVFAKLVEFQRSDQANNEQ